MSKFWVRERRAYEVEYLIEAVDEEAAQALDGEIIEENEGQSWADALLDVRIDEEEV